MYKNGIPQNYDLLGNTLEKVPKYSTEKWVVVNDQLEKSYSTSKQIRFKTSMLRSELCNYSDVYIVVKGTITNEGAENKYSNNRSLVFKNNTRFIGCISKINNVLIDTAEDLGVVMPMYNLIESNKAIKNNR